MATACFLGRIKNTENCNVITEKVVALKLDCSMFFVIYFSSSHLDMCPSNLVPDGTNMEKDFIERYHMFKSVTKKDEIIMC
jgi:hypothetical protein